MMWSELQYRIFYENHNQYFRHGISACGIRISQSAMGYWADERRRLFARFHVEIDCCRLVMEYPDYYPDGSSLNWTGTK